MLAKRWLCWLLAAVLCCGVVPMPALARETGTTDLVGILDAQIPQNNAYASPMLADGNHVQWIDRIADLPDFATDFYTWLEQNATESGALADPTKGTNVSGSYVYLLATVQGKVSYEGFTGSSARDRAEAAIAADLADTPSVISQYGAAVFGAFDRDHPEVFWLSGSSSYAYGTSYSYGGGWVDYTAYIYFYLKNSSFDLRKPEYRTVSAIQQGVAIRDAGVERILAGCPDGDPVEQIYYLNNALTTTNAYNSAVGAGNIAGAAGDAWECLSALDGRTGIAGPVCEGYARAFKILCGKLDIPCVLVEGPAVSSINGTPEGHMWNLVQVDGTWYAVDVTWNDPYSFGYDVPVSGQESEEWLLMGSNTGSSLNLTFGQSHQTTNKTTTNSLSYINGPVLSAAAYVKAPSAPVITLQYPTLLLEDEIALAIYFTVDRSDFDLDKIGLLTWTQAPQRVDISTADAVIAGAVYDDSKGMHRVRTEGIPAQNLGRQIYFCIYAQLPDGSYVYGKQVSYCPKTFAYNQLGDKSLPQLDRALYVAILNYGAAAQTYLSDTSGGLINDNLTDAQKAYARDFSSDMVHGVTMPEAAKQGTFLRTNTGFIRKEPTVSLDESFSINYYFTVDRAIPGDVIFYYWSEADFEACQTLTAENATGVLPMSADSGRYGAAIEGIAAKDIDRALYACGVYTDADGVTHSTGILPYSLGFFCGNQATAGIPQMRPLAMAIAVYGYYAAGYFA